MDRITTEAEWLACTDPLLLVNTVAHQASDRKLRLLLVSCCRRIWSLLQDRRLQEGAEVAERHADGMSNDAELAEAASAVSEVRLLRRLRAGPASFLDYANSAVSHVCFPQGHLGHPFSAFTGRYMRGSYRVMGGIDAAAEAASWSSREQEQPPALAQRTVPEPVNQCLLVRDLFASPFCPLLPLDPTWLGWNEGLIPKLAQAAYEERALPQGTFDGARLAVLADALEEAGCDDPALLAHLRGPGPHVRGCWSIDLLTGRK